MVLGSGTSVACGTLLHSNDKFAVRIIRSNTSAMAITTIIFVVSEYPSAFLQS